MKHTAKLTPAQRADKVSLLAESQGYDNVQELLEYCITDSVVPAICTTRDCDYEDDLEPDAIDCPCPGCGEHSVTSILVLANLI